MGGSSSKSSYCFAFEDPTATKRVSRVITAPQRQPSTQRRKSAISAASVHPAPSGGGGKESKAARRKKRMQAKLRAKSALQSGSDSYAALQKRKRSSSAAQSVSGAQHEMRDLVQSALLGIGGFGRVYLVKSKLSGERFALKSIEKTRLLRGKENKAVKYALHEKEALLECAPYPFIAQLHRCMQDQTHVHFLFDFFVGGDLLTRLRAGRRGALSNDEAKFYAAEIVLAVEHMHSRGVIHRDLKPENVMLGRTGHVKLVDFGFAVPSHAMQSQHGRCHSRVGTPYYLAPELLKPERSGGYTCVVDWWAWACLLHELLTGRGVFGAHDDSVHAVFIRVMKGRPRMSGTIHPKARALMTDMLTVDLAKRLHGGEMVRAHPWWTDGLGGGDGVLPTGRLDWARVERGQLRAPFAIGDAAIQEDGSVNLSCFDLPRNEPGSPTSKRIPSTQEQRLFAGF